MVWTVNGNTTDVCIFDSNELLDGKISCAVTTIRIVYFSSAKEEKENLQIVLKLLTESSIDLLGVWNL